MGNQNIGKKNTYNLSGLRNQHPQSTTKDLNVPDVPSLIQETLTQLEMRNLNWKILIGNLIPSLRAQRPQTWLASRRRTRQGIWQWGRGWSGMRMEGERETSSWQPRFIGSDDQVCHCARRWSTWWRLDSEAEGEKGMCKEGKTRWVSIIWSLLLVKYFSNFTSLSSLTCTIDLLNICPQKHSIITYELRKFFRL